MPRRHGRHSHYSKKSKALQRQAAAGTPPAVSQAVAGTPGVPGRIAAASAPPVSRSAAPIAKEAVNPYPYITSELRRIAVLGGIIIIILVVLVIVIS